MPQPIPQRTRPRDAWRLRRLLLPVALVTLAGCHSGWADARRLAASCDAGKATACNDLAHNLERGAHVLKDEGRAAALFDKGCSGGVAEACARLGAAYEDARAVKRDSTRALALHRKGCAGGSLDGCTRLGARYLSGAGVTGNVDTAAALFTRACNGGRPAGCAYLGELRVAADSGGFGIERQEYLRAGDGGASPARMRRRAGAFGHPYMDVR